MNSNNRDWIKEYLRCMMIEDYEAGLTLKELNLPKSFYKYRVLDERSIQNIENNQIWLAKLSSLNDPFECSLQFDNNAELRIYYATELFQKNSEMKLGFRFSTQEIAQLTTSKEPYTTYTEICLSKGIRNIKPEELLERVHRMFAEGNDLENEKLKISCFSERNDSLLMWSHYANEHKGICIEYDLAERDIIRPFLSPVYYSDQIFKISTFDELTPIKKIGALLTKCKDWEYEQEWRYTPIKQKGIDIPNKIDAPIPKAVYLGTRFDQNSDELKNELIRVLKNKNIPTYPMKKHYTEYKLTPL